MRASPAMSRGRLDPPDRVDRARASRRSSRASRAARSQLVLRPRGSSPASGRPRGKSAISKTWRTSITSPSSDRAARRPLDRLLLRLHLDQPVAADDLLRLGERAVDDRGLAARERDARALRARVQPVEREQHAGLRAAPRCTSSSRPTASARRRPCSCSSSVSLRDHQHHESHGGSSWSGGFNRDDERPVPKSTRLPQMLGSKDSARRREAFDRRGLAAGAAARSAASAT